MVKNGKSPGQNFVALLVLQNRFHNQFTEFADVFLEVESR
jgi:hypothetical protein